MRSLPRLEYSKPAWQSSAGGIPVVPEITPVQAIRLTSLPGMNKQENLRTIIFFTIPDSACDCLLWTTTRGGTLRMGQPSGTD
jgi:hypothetical protein